jgi:hypothetical protein
MKKYKKLKRKYFKMFKKQRAYLKLYNPKTRFHKKKFYGFKKLVEFVITF